jgi:large subunit ribosomal protein L11
MQIKLLVEGGAMKPGPALSQKLGPAGINLGKVISEVNEVTKEFKGIKVPVELNVNPKTKEFEIEVFSPPVSELLKKEVNADKGSGVQHKLNIGNLSIEQVIKISKTKMPNLLCNDLKTSVKTVLGSCVSLGILVENKPAKEIEEEIDSGKYDKEINEILTEPSEEKKKELEEHYKKLRVGQDKVIEAEKKEAEAKEEKAKK